MNINRVMPVVFAFAAIAGLAVGCVGDGDNEDMSPVSTEGISEGVPEEDSSAESPPTSEEGAVEEQIGIAESALSSATIPAMVTSFYIPPWVGGDQEYKGHGPFMSSQIQLYVFNGNELWASVYLDAIETKSDWTEAEGTAWFMLYKAPKNIAAINSVTFFQHQFTDTDHAHDIFSFAPSNLVQKLDYVGDTYGNEAGSKTGVKVYFNPISLTLY